MLTWLYWLTVPLLHAVILDLVLAVPGALNGQFGFGTSVLIALMFSFLSIPASLIAATIGHLLVRDGAAPRWVLSIGSSVYAIALNLLLFGSNPNGMPDSLNAMVLPGWLATTIGLFWIGWLSGASYAASRPPGDS